MKRVLIICVAVFALMGLASAALVVLSPGDEQGEPSEQLASPGAGPATTPTDPAAWNGAGEQDLNATFLVSGHQIILQQFSFGGLTRPKAALEARLLVIPAAGKAAPWLQRAFRLNSAKRTFNPDSVKITDTGRGQAVVVRFSKVPSAQLHGAIAFAITYPAPSAPGSEPGPRSISVAPLAPFAPGT